MSKLPTNARIALLVAGMVVAVLVGWFAVIAPKRQEVSVLKEQIDQTQTKIAEARGVQTPTGPPPIRVADLFRLSRAMPNTADIPGVILQLSRVAQETGVSFESITPHDPVPYGAYQQVGVDLTFEGRFYDLSDFLYRLRNLVSVRAGVLNATGRLFTVDSIALDEGTDTFPQVKAALTVSAYIFGDGTAPPVPAGAEPTDSTAPSTPAAGSAQPIPAAPVA